MGIFKYDKYNNITIWSIVSFNLIALIYALDSNQMNIKNSVRKLAQNEPNEICFEIDGNTKYNLFGLKNVDVELGENIEFRFCRNVEGYDSSCIYTKGDEKIKLAETIYGKDNNKNKIDASKNKVKMYLAAGDKCLKEEKDKYKIEIELYCSDEEFEIQNKTEFNPEEKCNLKFSAKTKYACGDGKAYFEPEGVWRIISGIVLTIIGVMAGILGYNQVKIGIFLVCTIGSVLLARFLLSLIATSKLAVILVIYILFLIVGIILFVFFIKKNEYLKYYMLLVGGICGYPIGLTIYNLFFAIIDTSHLKLIHAIIIVIFIIIGVILGYIVPKYTCIVGTSIMGAFFLMKGISYFLYGKVNYINEEKLYDLASTGNYEKIADMIWSSFLIYPAILIVFIVVFIIVQIKINPNWKDVDDYKDLDNKFIEKPSDLPDFKLPDYGETTEEEKKD